MNGKNAFKTFVSISWAKSAVFIPLFLAQGAIPINVNRSLTSITSGEKSDRIFLILPVLIIIRYPPLNGIFQLGIVITSA